MARPTLARSVATEACRQAANGPDFIQRVYRETGIVLDIIGTVELDTYLSVITAALVVMLFRTTTPPKREIDLDQVLHDRSLDPLTDHDHRARLAAPVFLCRCDV